MRSGDKLNSQAENKDENQLVPAGPVFANRGCCFQWYAVTHCNYVELVGAFGWEIDSTRKHVRTT
jgi:hypothetical protein